MASLKVITLLIVIFCISYISSDSNEKQSKQVENKEQDKEGSVKNKNNASKEKDERSKEKDSKENSNEKRKNQVVNKEQDKKGSNKNKNNASKEKNPKNDSSKESAKNYDPKNYPKGKKDERSKEKDSNESSSNESKSSGEKNDQKDSKGAKQKWTFNPETGMMTVYAASTAAVAVLDSKNQLSALYNGNTGTAVLYNNLNGEAFFIAAGSSQETWYKSKKKFEDFFSKMKSQQAIWQIGKKDGLMFDAVSINNDISKELNQILMGLSKDFSNPCSAYAIYLQLSTTLTTCLNNGLKGFSAAIGNVDVDYQGDLLWLNGVFRGMGDFFALIKGGLNTLKEKKVEINLNTVLQMSSGSHVWMYFIKEMSNKIDIGDLAKTYNNFQNFFDIIDKFGGNVKYGPSGLFNIISKIVGQLNGQASIRTVQAILQTYFQSDRTNIDNVKTQFKSDIQYLITNLRKLSQFKDLARLLDSILQGKWTYKNVNISNIITILTDKNSQKDVSKSIKKIVEILNKKKK